MVLGDPEVGCGGDKVGPWCLTWKDAVPGDLEAKAREALSRDAAKDVWVTSSDIGGHVSRRSTTTATGTAISEPTTSSA